MNTNLYWKEAKYELLKLGRSRRYSVSVLAMPLMFYFFFALAMPAGSGFHLPTYLVATYGTFGVMSACLYGVGAHLAQERSLGWLEMKRVSPLGVSTYLFGKIAASLVFCLAVELLLLAAGLLFGNVRLTMGEALSLIAVLLIGAVPFAALGVGLGYLMQANAAPAFLNMINMPMAFCSGLWIPFMFLPPMLQKVAMFLPSYHLSKLALDVIGMDHSPAIGHHLEALAAFTLIFIGFAAWAVARNAQAGELR